MRVSVVATGIDANQARNFRAPSVKSDFSTAFSGYSKSEDAEYDVPETSYENVASSFNENTRPEQENVDLEEDSTEINDQSVSASKSLVDADQLEQSTENYVGLSEPGAPSPEAMARLRAAVEKVPPETRLTQAPEPKAIEPLEKPKFGFNSLINRMTGQNEVINRNEVSAPSTVKDQTLDGEDVSDERIDIPAFLRRQAN